MVNAIMKFSNINIKDIIESHLRFEASVYNIESRASKEVIKKSKFELIPLVGDKGLANAFVGNRFKRVFVEKSPYPIFQPSQITDIFPKEDLYISKKTKTDIDSLRVKTGQILLTCSGTIGKCTIVTDYLNNKIFSHDLIRITPKKINSAGYLYVFIKSKIGQVFLNTNNYGAVIQHIEPEHLENIIIPNPPDNLKEKIHNKIIKSFMLRDESNLLIDNAEKLLIRELQLPPIEELQADYNNKASDFENFVVPSNQLNNRFDASYHNPIVLNIIDILLDHSSKISTLANKEICKEIILPGRFKRTYVDAENGVTFLGGKQINELDPTGKKYLSRKFHSQRIRKELFLKENMIVVTCSGTIGKTNIVPKHWENWTMSQHVIRVVPSSNDFAGYLFIWINSDYGKALIERFIYGSVVDEIDKIHMLNFEVPILKNKEIQEEINNLALKANELRSKAYYLEQEALKIFNKEVLQLN